MPRAINEKTLELNLCSELSRFFRLLGLQSVWRGLTQQQEKRWGFDVATKLSGGRLFFIQWKAVSRIKASGGYTFSLNDDQMVRMARLGTRYPGAAFYGFPRVLDWSDYRSQKFLALPNTRFLDSANLLSHPSIGKQRTHTATIAAAGSTVRITSVPKTYSALRFAEIFGGPESTRLDELLTGIPNFQFLRFQEKNIPSQGFLIADEIGPEIINMRGRLMKSLPSANSEQFRECINLLEGEEENAKLPGLYCGLIFDSQSEVRLNY